MPNSVLYDSESGVIAIRIQSRIDEPVMRELASEVARIANEHSCFLVLNDAREATSGLSTVEIYDMPSRLQEILLESGIAIHKFKRAVVVANDIDDFTFFETVSQNRGQNVKTFHDIGEAKSWLLSK